MVKRDASHLESITRWEPEYKKLTTWFQLKKFKRLGNELLKTRVGLTTRKRNETIVTVLREN